MDSRNRQLEVHYINTGLPYTVMESITNLFEGLTYSFEDLAYDSRSRVHNQDNAYWGMDRDLYKHSSWDMSDYEHNFDYEVDEELLAILASRRIEDQSNMNSGSHIPVSPEHRTQDYDTASNPQINWQDSMDSGNMTYEELLGLGETIGTCSRGLSKGLISTLPVSKYKGGGFFSRKKSREERCVICQMEYKKGDRQITLPCKHVYHAPCVSQWLSINKSCPVCNFEVSGNKSKLLHSQ